MTAPVLPTIVAVRVRRASDDAVLAENTSAPLTPITWAGAEAGVDVYIEMATAGGVVFKSAATSIPTAAAPLVIDGQAIYIDGQAIYL